MSTEATRRIKVLVTRKIKIDPEVNSLGGDNPQVFKPGEVVALYPVQVEHYQRHGCVTRDLPLEALDA